MFNSMSKKLAAVGLEFTTVINNIKNEGKKDNPNQKNNQQDLQKLLNKFEQLISDKIITENTAMQIGVIYQLFGMQKGYITSYQKSIVYHLLGISSPDTHTSSFNACLNSYFHQKDSNEKLSCSFECPLCHSTANIDPDELIVVITNLENLNNISIKLWGKKLKKILRNWETDLPDNHKNKKIISTLRKYASCADIDENLDIDTLCDLLKFASQHNNKLFEHIITSNESLSLIETEDQLFKALESCNNQEHQAKLLSALFDQRPNFFNLERLLNILTYSKSNNLKLDAFLVSDCRSIIINSVKTDFFDYFQKNLSNLQILAAHFCPQFNFEDINKPNDDDYELSDNMSEKFKDVLTLTKKLQQWFEKSPKNHTFKQPDHITHFYNYFQLCIHDALYSDNENTIEQKYKKLLHRLHNLSKMMHEIIKKNSHNALVAFFSSKRTPPEIKYCNFALCSLMKPFFEPLHFEIKHSATFQDDLRELRSTFGCKSEFKIVTCNNNYEIEKNDRKSFLSQYYLVIVMQLPVTKSYCTMLQHLEYFTIYSDNRKESFEITIKENDYNYDYKVKYLSGTPSDKPELTHEDNETIKSTWYYIWNTCYENPTDPKIIDPKKLVKIIAFAYKVLNLMPPKNQDFLNCFNEQLNEPKDQTKIDHLQYRRVCNFK